MKITVLGGTGYGGAAVVAEAAKRGHQVTAVSRRPPAQPIENVTYVTGNLVDPDFLQRAVAGADVVFEALSPRGDMAEQAEIVFGEVGRLAAGQGFRFGVLGGVLFDEGAIHGFHSQSPSFGGLPSGRPSVRDRRPHRRFLALDP